jgi:Uncharacterised nucleotidyltransferase
MTLRCVAVAGLEPPDRSSQLAPRAGRLRLDAATADLFRGFDLAGVEVLLLKGRSIANWLYAGLELRTYSDCDVLVAPSAAEAAEAVLGSLGFRPLFDDRGMPAWWREHASTWSDGERLTVDLHRTLPGVGVNDATTCGVLSAGADVVLVAGHPAPTLALPARALHVALHAAHHGVGWPRPIEDLERALAAGEDELWLSAAALAGTLQATDAFVAGLRLAPAGEELAARLGLPPVRSVDVELRARSPPPVALGLEQLARAQSTRARAEIVWRKFVPPPSFIRHWDPRAGHSRSSLLRAYVRRPLWILRRAPRALHVWHRARRSVRAGPRTRQP